MNHLFFWFFPAPQDLNAPVVVWLNGGPGVPSMFGLLHENGPIKILKNLSDGEVSYEKREHSWSDVFSMLYEYIDNPVEVGYSYTESGEKGYRTTQNGYSSDLYNFMEQFYIMFPEYLDNQLYLGGQSYAGKYISAMAYRIHIYGHFKDDIAVSVKDKLTVLMDNYKAFIFNGEFDAKITSNGIDDGLLSTSWSLQAQYNASERSAWYRGDKSSSFYIKAFYQHVGQFCRVVIRGAGHQTPYDQPEVTLEMMRHFVEYGCIKDD